MTDHLRSMRLELEKTSAPVPFSLAQRAGRFISSNLAKTTALGAGVGAAAGAAKERSDGGSGVGGAIKGGIIGALGGGAAGRGSRMVRDTKIMNPGVSNLTAAKITAQRMGTNAKRLGQRQRHGFTGYKGDDPGSIGLRSSATSEKRVRLLGARKRDEMLGTSAKRRGAIKRKYDEQIKSVRGEGRAGDAALSAGITSLPGIARGLRKDPRGTAKAMWNEAVGTIPGETGSPGGKLLRRGLAVGLPAAAYGPDLARGDESAEGGRSLSEKVVGMGTGVVGGMMVGGLPIAPALAAGAGLDSAGAALARRASGKKRKQ